MDPGMVYDRLMESEERKRLAAQVRRACLEAALLAHEDAGLAGLCAEGRWEAAVDAIRSVDLAGVVDEPAA
jgi:hypothetical protein